MCLYGTQYGCRMHLRNWASRAKNTHLHFFKPNQARVAITTVRARRSPAVDTRAMADEQTFGSVSLIAGGITSQGALRLGADKVEWKKAGGGRSVAIAKADVGEVTYSQIPGGVTLTVRSKGTAPAMRMKGFRGSDMATVKEAMKALYDVDVVKRDMQVIGRNWGQIEVDQAGAITFDVEGKRQFEISSKDVAAVAMPTKHEVMLEFHMDDAVMNASKDAMVEMSFYVPPTNKTWGVDGWGTDDHDPDDTGAKRLSDRLMEVCDVDTATGDAIAEFDSVSLVAPRGKVGIELFANHLRLNGNAVDFKIQHSSIQRLFLLPKPTNAQTYAILHLDPPIRKGQTFYPHIVAVFNANEELEVEPLMDAALKEKLGDAVEDSYDGPSSEVFIRLLKAVAGVKLTRQGTFASPAGGHAVKASNKAEVGHLYPLEKSFFYLPKPPMLLPYAEVTEIEFERHAGAGPTTQRTFDMAITMRNGAVHQFHSIPKSEFQNLVSFLTAKKLKIVNVDAQARADAIIDGADSDSDRDHHAARLKAKVKKRELDEDGFGGSDSEEDEDFNAGSESDDGEPTDSSGSEGSDDEEEARPKKKTKSKAKAKAKAKKDPNEPKRPLSAFMIFSKETRGDVLEKNPDFALGDVGKELGRRWREIDPELKKEFEAKAADAKVAYEAAMKEYKAGKKATVVDDDDDEEEEESDGGSD